MKNDLSFERADALFRYCPNTGQLNWKVLVGRRRNPISCKDGGGYVVVDVDGRQYKAHRIIWTMAHGSPPELSIDHINRDKADNRLENLRQATVGQNAWNQGIHSKAASGFKGVKHRDGKYWTAQVVVAGKTIHLGTFKTKEDAVAGRLAGAKRYIGEFGPLETWQEAT